jgi:ActR/RegA family two-component response regulator
MRITCIVIDYRFTEQDVGVMLVYLILTRIEAKEVGRSMYRSSARSPVALVLDTEPQITALLCRAFKLHGFDTFAAIDSLAATRELESTAFDFVLIDIASAGVSLNRFVYSVHVGHLALMSASHDSHIAVFCACSYFQKPFPPSDVVAAAVRVVGKEDLKRSKEHLARPATDEIASLYRTENILRLSDAMSAHKTRQDSSPGMAECDNVGTRTQGVAPTWNRHAHRDYSGLIGKLESWEP